LSHFVFIILSPFFLIVIYFIVPKMSKKLSDNIQKTQSVNSNPKQPVVELIPPQAKNWRAFSSLSQSKAQIFCTL